MFRIARLILPLAVVAVACSDGPSSVPERGIRASQPSYDEGGSSATDGINDIVTALNAAWGKSAAGYAAPFAEDAVVIASNGNILSGRPEIETRHAFLFSGPLKGSTQIVSIRRVQFLTGTIAIVDVDAVITGTVASKALVRWVVTKNSGTWEIEAQQSTTVP